MQAASLACGDQEMGGTTLSMAHGSRSERDNGPMNDMGVVCRPPLALASMATPRHIPEFSAMPSSPTLSATTRSTSPDYGYGASPRGAVFQSLELVKDFKNLAVNHQMPTTPPITPKNMGLGHAVKTAPEGDFQVLQPAASRTGSPTIEPIQPGDEQDAKSEVQTCTVSGETPPASDVSYDGEWDGHSTDSDGLSEEAIDGILAFSLRRIFGVDLHDVALSPDHRRQLVGEFVQNLGLTLVSLPSELHVRTAQGSSSANSPSAQPAGQAGQADQGAQHRQDNRKGKRKKDDSDPDPNWRRDSQDRDEGGTSKRVRESQKLGLRLSCPFRKRNPCRFNCRDYYSCAFTYFTNFADLK